MKHKVKRIHFVGIGGSGMSGIAEVLLNLGYQVSGSDLAANAATERLAGLGAKVVLGHKADNVAAADAVVVSSAVKPDNPEIVAAQAKRIPVVPRALMLAELMRLKQGIAVAGTHGKTTTTSLIASVLAEGGLDPTFVIGGRLVAAASNARLGTGEFIVVEADESDASFLHLQPVAAVVPSVSKPIVIYGLREDAMVRAADIVAGERMRFKAVRERAAPLDITLNLPGRHNVQNALAAIAVATELGVGDAAIRKALAEFRGVGRRFQRYGEIPLGPSGKSGGSFTLVDDYGHHPAEMRATLDAARGAFPGRRVVLAFQPHRYTRTRDLFEDFVKTLSGADALLLAEVYAAGEAPIVAADGRSLARAIRVAGKTEPVFVENIADMPGAIRKIARAGDVVVTMGAGSIGSVPLALAKDGR